jgi:hypothetical protein
MQYRVVYNLFEPRGTRSPEDNPRAGELVGAHIGADVIDGTDRNTAWGQRVLQDRRIPHVARDNIVRPGVYSRRGLLRTVNQRPDGLSSGAERPDYSPARLAGSTSHQDHDSLKPGARWFMDFLRCRPIV